jgi:3-hydroxyisobutyrate dehydrogenase-like beta-hydroxyacid dehydrogenase
VSTKERIGFIGIGLMGHGMAKNLVAKGHPLKFRVNRNRDNIGDLLAAGAVEVKTDADCGRDVDVVFICVTGSPQVEQVVYGPDGLMQVARPGLTVVDCSTSEPDSTARIRADFAQHGTDFVDAPLTRTPKEAEEGRLNTMVGAEPAVFERLHPVLAAFCENVFHVGPPGHDTVIKLVNNFVSLAQIAAIAEGYAAAARAGVDLRKLFELMSAGAVNSGLLQGMIGGALEGDLGRLKFAIANAQKDLRYYTHLTETMPMASPVAEAVHQSFVQASALGLGEKFTPSMLELQEKLNGVRIVPRR